jgi:hypothetical protein
MAYPPNFTKASRKYRPQAIKVLFIAEAPPALRFERFFYFVRVSEADTLFLEMMKVLYPIDTGFVEYEDGRKPEFDAKRVRLQKAKLLEKFKRDGFYLIDASEQPMPEDADTTSKKHIIGKALPELRRKARELCSAGNTPVILIGAPTYSICAEALRRDGLHVLNQEMINSPARGGQKLFRLKARQGPSPVRHSDLGRSFVTSLPLKSSCASDPSAPRMLPSPLRKDQDAYDNQHSQRRRCGIAAQVKTSLSMGLVEKVADNRAQRTGQNKCGPK